MQHIHGMIKMSLRKGAVGPSQRPATLGWRQGRKDRFSSSAMGKMGDTCSIDTAIDRAGDDMQPPSMHYPLGYVLLRAFQELLITLHGRIRFLNLASISVITAPWKCSLSSSPTLVYFNKHLLSVLCKGLWRGQRNQHQPFKCMWTTEVQGQMKQMWIFHWFWWGSQGRQCGGNGVEVSLEKWYYFSTQRLARKAISGYSVTA